MTYDFLTPLYSDIPEGWEDFFKIPEVETALKKIQRVIDREGRNIVPHPSKVFNAFRYTHPRMLRVVIYGQDPYHTIKSDGTPVAVGLSFSVGKDDIVPKSLKNIFNEIKREYDIENISGDLTNWALQGVMLLNINLTTVEGQAGAHSGKYDIWKCFILEFIKYAHSSINPNIINILWGRDAEKIEDHIPKTANILKSSHPSPLSFSRGEFPFVGNDHFKKINEILEKLGDEPIDWRTE